MSGLGGMGMSGRRRGRGNRVLEPHGAARGRHRCGEEGGQVSCRSGGRHPAADSGASGSQAGGCSGTACGGRGAACGCSGTARGGRGATRAGRGAASGPAGETEHVREGRERTDCWNQRRRVTAREAANLAAEGPAGRAVTQMLASRRVGAGAAVVRCRDLVADLATVHVPRLGRLGK